MAANMNTNSTGVPHCDNSQLSMHGAPNESTNPVNVGQRHLVPTQDDFVNAGEPSQEYQDILAFEQTLLNTTFTCQDCGSDEHAGGLCKQNEAAWNPQFLTSFEDIPIKEQVARGQLSRGIPQMARSCQRHSNELHETLMQHNTFYDPDAPIPGSTNGLPSQTALLPICYPCFKKKSLHTDDKPFPSLDACLCATGIIAADCWACAIERIIITKSMIKTRLTKKLDSGVEVITCGCGAVVGPEMARLCSGCNCIVTLPALAFTGDMVTFTANNTNQVVVCAAPRPDPPPQIQQQVASVQNATTNSINGGVADGYQSVSSMLTHNTQQNKLYEAVSPLERTHVAMTAAEVSQLKAQSLNIDGPFHSTNARAVLDPRLRLGMVVDNLKPPIPALDAAAVDRVLGVCGFEKDEKVALMNSLRTVFNGSISATNLSVLVITALGYKRPEADTTAAPLTPAAEPVEDTEMTDAVE